MDLHLSSMEKLSQKLRVDFWNLKETEGAREWAILIYFGQTIEH